MARPWSAAPKWPSSMIVSNVPWRPHRADAVVCVAIAVERDRDADRGTRRASENVHALKSKRERPARKDDVRFTTIWSNADAIGALHNSNGQGCRNRARKARSGKRLASTSPGRHRQSIGRSASDVNSHRDEWRAKDRRIPHPANFLAAGSMAWRTRRTRRGRPWELTIKSPE